MSYKQFRLEEENSALVNQLLADVATLHKFVWRDGANAGADFGIGTGLTADATWRTLDLSSIIPATTAVVFLQLVIKDNVTLATVYFRKSATDTYQIQNENLVANLNHYQNNIVGVDSQNIQYYIDNGMDFCTVKVFGWWTTL